MSRYNKVGYHKTQIIRFANGVLQVKYHDTIVFQQNADGSITLDTGGWLTATTKLRINQASGQFLNGRIGVYQEKHQWYIVDKAAAVVEPVKWHGQRITIPSAGWPQ